MNAKRIEGNKWYECMNGYVNELKTLQQNDIEKKFDRIVWTLRATKSSADHLRDLEPRYTPEGNIHVKSSKLEYDIRRYEINNFGCEIQAAEQFIRDAQINPGSLPYRIMTYHLTMAKQAIGTKSEQGIAFGMKYIPAFPDFHSMREMSPARSLGDLRESKERSDSLSSEGSRASSQSRKGRGNQGAGAGRDSRGQVRK